MKIFFLLMIICCAEYLCATTYTVTSVASGTTTDGVSLRWAITQANANAGADVIDFAVSGTLTLASALPALTDNAGVTINGNTAPGYVANTNLAGALNGTLTFTISGDSLFSSGITVSSDNNTINGLNFIYVGTLAGSADAMIDLTSGADNNRIFGCYIGTTLAGTAKAGYVTDYGIRITDGANNQIGDGTAAGRNLIGGLQTSSSSGIYITGALSTGNTIKGNIIGLKKDGIAILDIAAQGYGVYITASAASNTIGGTLAGEENVLSGNGSIGVYFYAAGTAGNAVLGNIIGPQANGTSNVTSNIQTTGVKIQDSPNNIIGGNTSGARNTISANLTYGVYITGVTSFGNLLKGNYIGTDKNGTTFISGSSQDYGVYIVSSAAGNTIGGAGAGEGNVISGNSNQGIYFSSTSTSGNSILGNIIGPQANGTSILNALPGSYQSSGVYITGSPNNIIGGSAAGARNIISANETYGIFIIAAGSTGNLVKGNYIGLDNTGATFITGSTQNHGVYIAVSASGNTIGGTGAGEGNVISGNSDYGIRFTSTASAGNSVLGNIIGPQADGTSHVTSNVQMYGVFISGSPNNIIGGSAAGARNIISANTTYGVYITGAGSTGNSVKGNYIGSGSALSSITGSDQDEGVHIISSAANNAIGGALSGEGNIIAFNTMQGVYVWNAASTGNKISRNPVYSNTGKPINLTYTATPGNNGKAVPVISTSNTATVSGTSGAGDVVEVFKNTTGNCNNAVTFVGSATSDGSGNWLLAVSLSANDYVLATATDGSNNTSEFTACTIVVVLPVELIYFNAAIENNRTVRTEWATATEINNDYFTVERGTKKEEQGTNIEWKEIGSVKGAGNSSTPLHYEFVDEFAVGNEQFANLQTANWQLPTLYYRLKQTDYDGKYEYFGPVSVTCNSENEIMILPSISDNGYFSITGLSAGANVTVYNLQGEKIYSAVITEQSYVLDISRFTNGAYMVQIGNREKVQNKKIMLVQ